MTQEEYQKLMDGIAFIKDRAQKYLTAVRGEYDYLRNDYNIVNIEYEEDAVNIELAIDFEGYTASESMPIEFITMSELEFGGKINDMILEKKTEKQIQELAKKAKAAQSEYNTYLILKEKYEPTTKTDE